MENFIHIRMIKGRNRKWSENGRAENRAEIQAVTVPDFHEAAVLCSGFEGGYDLYRKARDFKWQKYTRLWRTAWKR